MVRLVAAEEVIPEAWSCGVRSKKGVDVQYLFQVVFYLILLVRGYLVLGIDALCVENVGYLPEKVVNYLGASKIRIYVMGENLKFWSARKGLDPRYDYAENTLVTVYSPVRTISGGFQLTF